jgi:hypothetical protein
LQYSQRLLPGGSLGDSPSRVLDSGLALGPPALLWGSSALCSVDDLLIIKIDILYILFETAYLHYKYIYLHYKSDYYSKIVKNPIDNRFENIEIDEDNILEL